MLSKQRRIEFERHEDNQQEGRNADSSPGEGSSAMGLPTIPEEHTNSRNMTATFSLASQDKLAPSTTGAEQAKGKGKARIRPRSAPNLAHVMGVKGASKARDSRVESRGSATQDESRALNADSEDTKWRLSSTNPFGEGSSRGQEAPEHRAEHPKDLSTGTDVDRKPNRQRRDTSEI